MFASSVIDKFITIKSSSQSRMCLLYVCKLLAFLCPSEGPEVTGRVLGDARGPVWLRICRVYASRMSGTDPGTHGEFEQDSAPKARGDSTALPPPAGEVSWGYEYLNPTLGIHEPPNALSRLYVYSAWGGRGLRSQRWSFSIWGGWLEELIRAAGGVCIEAGLPNESPKAIGNCLQPTESFSGEAQGPCTLISRNLGPPELHTQKYHNPQSSTIIPIIVP